MHRIRVQKISRWALAALAPVVVARTVAIAIRLILKLDLEEARAFKPDFADTQSNPEFHRD